MPRYQFLVPGLGVVTMDHDTEACARHTLSSHIGYDPDRLELLNKDPGAPVFEGDPYARSSQTILDDQGRLDDEVDPDEDPELRPGEKLVFSDGMPAIHLNCDCSDCLPDLVRIKPLHLAVSALAVAIIGASVTFALGLGVGAFLAK